MPHDFKRTFRLDRSSRSDAHASVEDELAHHIDLCVEELVDEGWSPDEARREAVRQFGDLKETQTYCESMQTRRGREERRVMFFDELAQDLMHSLRAIRKAPGYAALVVLTLAFGIAANTTIFSVMNPYLFRPLPFGQPDELVQVNQMNPITGWDMDRFSYPQYEDWKARTRAFTDVAAYSYGSTNVTDQQGPEQIQFSYLTVNMFDVLDAQPVIGRTFSPDEGLAGGDPVVVMAEGLWQRRYSADLGIVGRTITMDGVQHTVIGVMPADFNFPFGGVKLWVPVQVDGAAANRANGNLQLIGRLNDGWAIERAREELTQIQSELGALFPDIDGRMSGVSVKPLREALNFAWDVISVLFTVLLGAVGFVLLIACVNVASLTLARASGRQREVSVRAALGARRGRIVRQLLTESLVLALLGGVVGVGLAYWVTSMLNPVIPEDLFKIGAIDIDRVVLGFSVLVTLATPVAFGLLPALSASKVDLTIGLKEGSKGSGGLASSRGRRLLVVTQVALAVVLITGAGLMLRSFASVQRLDLGFDSDRIATMEVILPSDEYPSGEERRLMMAEAVEAVAGLPAVESASAVTWLPLNHESIADQFASPDMAGLPPDEWPLAISNFIYPGYFETMGIGLTAGRDFATMDGVDEQGVVIVNDALADRFWPNGDAVGQTLLVGEPNDPHTVAIVGVVEDVRHTDLNQAETGAQLYRPALQASARRFFVLARTPGEPTDLFSGIRGATGAVAPDLPLTIRTMNDTVRENQIQWSLSSVFLALFGGGALLLATLGIYGLISYSVAQRERELGVRLALGATGGEIRRSVVRDGLALTGMGLAVGLVAALGLGQLISSVLYGVSPHDPITLVAVMMLFIGVAAVASFVPAARASSTNPIEVLRSE